MPYPLVSVPSKALSPLVLTMVTAIGMTPAALADSGVRLDNAVSLYEEGTFVEGLIVSGASQLDANASGGYVGRIRQGTANTILTVEKFVGAVDRDASLTTLVDEGQFGSLFRNELISPRIGADGRVLHSGQASSSQQDNISVLWLEDTLLAQDGTPTGLPDGGGFTGFTALQLADDGTPIFRGSFGSDGEAIFAGLGNTLIRTGDDLGISGNAVTDLSNPDVAPGGLAYGTRVNDTFGGTDEAIVASGVILARESDVIGTPNGGNSPLETYNSFANIRVNDAGDTLFSADTSDDDWITVYNGQVVLREGLAQDGLIPIATSNIGLGLNASGDYAVSYQNGLFLNGELLTDIDLDVPIENLTSPGIETFQGSLDLSDRYVIDEQTFVDIFVFARKESFTSNDSAILRITAEILETLTGLAGDYDDSGQVEQGDLNLVLANWGQLAPFEPNAGPFNTPSVDQEELDRVLSNWGNTLMTPNFSVFAVPEPAGAAILGLLAFGLIRRNSRK